MANTALFIYAIVALLFMNVFIGYLATETELEDTLNKFEGANFGDTVFTDTQETIDKDVVCINSTSIEDFGVVHSVGSWNFSCEHGLMSIGEGKNQAFLFLEPSIENSTYKNKYFLQNPEHKNYKVYMLWVNEWIPTAQYAYEIRVSNTGFLLVRTTWLDNVICSFSEEECWGGGTWFGEYLYPNANELETINITTEYNFQEQWFKVYLENNVIIFHDFAGTDPRSKLAKEIYYGGLEVYGTGLELHKVISQVHTTYNTEFSWFSFITNMIALTIWNIDESILPWQLNILFVKSHVMLLIVCIAQFIRGDG